MDQNKRQGGLLDSTKPITVYDKDGYRYELAQHPKEGYLKKVVKDGYVTYDFHMVFKTVKKKPLPKGTYPEPKPYEPSKIPGKTLQESTRSDPF